MKRPTCLVLMMIALTACVPVAGPTYTSGISPNEAGRIVDAATATAAVVATEVARATATDVAARATATAAWQQTQDTLAVEQTRAAIALTTAWGVGEATEAAAVRTAAAGATLDGRRMASVATNSALTPVAAATSTAMALGVLEATARQERAAAAAEFWDMVRWLIVATIAGLSLITAALVVTRGAVYIQAEAQRAAMATAREGFKILGGGYWAEWQPDGGYNVWQMPQLAAPQGPVIDAPTTSNLGREYSWRHAVRLYAWWGDRYGFGLRDLGPMGKNVVADPGWRAMTKLMRDAGVLAEKSVPNKRGRVTTWADGWNYARLAAAIGTADDPFRYSTTDDPPAVMPTVPNTTPQ